MLVRLAALVAVDAPPVSYLLTLGASRDVGIDAEQVRGVLAAVAPIVGTARIAAATGHIVRGIGIGIEAAEPGTEPGEEAPCPATGPRPQRRPERPQEAVRPACRHCPVSPRRLKPARCVRSSAGAHSR